MRDYDLGRFEYAQRGVYETALEEIRAGRKRTHWMWFVFPQVAGLGLSEKSIFYAIGSLEEAQAFAAHSLLGARLREITEAMTFSVQSDPVLILGATDSAKFRSSMTLFNAFASEPDCFRTALDTFYHGTEDELTVQRVTSWRRNAAR